MVFENKSRRSPLESKLLFPFHLVFLSVSTTGRASVLSPVHLLSHHRAGLEQEEKQETTMTSNRITRSVARQQGARDIPQNLSVFQRQQDQRKRKFRSLKLKYLAAKRQGRIAAGLPAAAPRRPNRVRYGWVNKDVEQFFQPDKTKGLENPLNWCYQNSIMQCLMHMSEYCALLQNVHEACTIGRTCAACSLKEMLQRYWSNGTTATVSSAQDHLNTALRASYGPTEPRIGEDLHNDRQSCPFDWFQAAVPEQFRGAPLSFGTHPVGEDVPAVDKAFAVSLTNWLECQHCHTRAHRPLQIQDGLQFALDPTDDNTQDLVDRIRVAFSGTTTGSFCYCNASVAAGVPEKLDIYRIQEWPQILVLRINRFYHDASNGSMGAKLENEVDYPEVLDLSEFAASNTDSIRYRLDGVVSHIGSIEFGHYISHVRDPNGPVFLEVDDEDMYDVGSNISSLQRPHLVQGNEEFTPYVLVYSRL